LENRLRIAMLSTHSCPLGPLGTKDTGGMSVYVRELSSELGRHGHSVDIYTRIHDSNEAPIIRLSENVKLIHLKAGDEDLHKIAIYPYIPEYSYYLENYRRENGLRYDIIFSHYWISGCVGELARIWWRVPHITMFHTVAAVKNSIGENEPEVRLKTENHLAQSCDMVIAATEREKENIIRYYDAPPERISVIPCGVNLDLFKPFPANLAKEELGLNGKKVILFVGRIERLKGIPRLIKAVSLLKTKHFRLVIIGGDAEDDPEIERLGTLAKQLSLQNSVQFVGRVPQEELPLYYAASDVTVIPSYMESFGLVVLESLACGTPVVATDVGDMKNIVQPELTGFVAEKGTPSDVAQKIDLVLSQTARQPSQIRETVIRYSWQKVAEETEQAFFRAIQGYSDSRLNELMCKELSF